MHRNQWLKIIPFFLCIFSLMSLFLMFGKTVVNAPEIETIHGSTKEYSGWKAAVTTLYSWLMIAFPVLILLAKLVPDAHRFEPLTSLLLPGVHIVIMFVTFYHLRSIGLSSDELGVEVKLHVGIGFILMLACQLAMIVLRLMEMTARPAAPAKPKQEQGLLPVEEERYPARRR